MIENKIKWDKVAVEEEREISFLNQQLSIEINGNKQISSNMDVKIKYIIYKYKYSNEETYYQRVINLPFYCKSTWTKTKPKEKNILELLEASLRKRYKDVLLRDFTNKIKFKDFQALCDKGVSIEEFSHDLHHKSPMDSIGDKKIGDLVQKFYEKTYNQKFSDINYADYKFDLTWEKFIQMMIEDNCAYCGISMKQINEIKLYTKRARGYSMEVDQKDPYGFYSDSNCVACCYWCNNAKTDEFTVSEFKEIARDINNIWRQRGADIIDFDKIEFWNNLKLTQT